jgi:S1-C subfamily serine protease
MDFLWNANVRLGPVSIFVLYSEKVLIMRRPFSVSLLFLASIFAAQAQPHLVKVRVRVILVDRELNQKPVPFLPVSLKNAAKSVEVKTGLDGTAETNLPPGKYAISTPKPTELDGRRFSWSVIVTLTGDEQNVHLTNDNATSEESATPTPKLPSSSGADNLAGYFKRLKNTVVTVKSETGQGTGFFVDSKGLVLTNQHVVGKSAYLAVQFDREHKIAARLIAADEQKDVALLWVNMAALPNASPAPLDRAAGNRAPVQEGQRVFTIGSPLTLEKIITTGIVSKVEPHTILSDININPGNSGGPLFNSDGQVIGLTTFGAQDQAGPGVSGIVRIEEALPLLEQNRAKASGTPPPGALLPVEPLTPYPVTGLKEALKADKLDARPYYLEAGDFYVALSTPPFDYREQEERRLQAERTHQKRNQKSDPSAATDTSEDPEAPKRWEEETGAHPAVLGIYVMPKAKEGIGSALGRSFNVSYTAKLKFKNDFQAMKLFCGNTEVQPINPGRVPVTVSLRNRAVKMEDSTYKGVYLFPPDAVNPSCREMKLAIYSSKGDEPVIKVLNEKSVQRVWDDFAAFRRAEEEAKRGKN